MHRRISKGLIFILLLAFILRIGLLIVTYPDLSRAESPDTHTYMVFAQAIRAGQFWSYPSAERTPGYPLFLALFNGQYLSVILAQIVLSLVTVYMTYRLSNNLLGNEKFALWAAALMACSMESITHSYYLLTETLFTILFLISIFAMVQAKEKSAWGWITISAVSMACAILTRPIALYYPIIMVLFFLRETVSWRIRLQKIGLFCAIMIIFIGGWVVRNMVVLSIPTVSTITSQNLLYYNAASLEAARSGQNEKDVREKFSVLVEQTIREQNLEPTLANRTRIANDLAKEIILSDPLRYAFIHLKSDINSLLPDTDALEILGITGGQKGTLDYIKQNGILAGINYYFDGQLGLIFILLPAIVLLCLVYFGSAVAVIRLWWKKQIYPLAVLILPILYGILLPGSPSNPRFRVPVMPFLCVLAGYGCLIAWEFLRKKKINSIEKVQPDKE